MMSEVKRSVLAAIGLGAQYLDDHSPVGQLVFTYDGLIIHTNHTLRAWLEITDETAAGNNFYALLSRSGKMYFQMFALPLLQMQGRVSEISLEIALPLKESFPCLFYAREVTIQENEKYICATIIKISDRKKFEQQLIRDKQLADDGRNRLQFLANIIDNLLFTLGPGGYISFVNERFYQHFNLTSNDFEKFVFTTLVHPDDKPATIKLWKACFKNVQRFDSEVRLINAVNDYEWFMIHIVPYIDEAGKPVEWFGSCTNIQKQKQLVETLNNNLTLASETLAKNNVSFKEIAFEQSHVVRLPLANILGIINLIEDTELNNETLKLLSMLKHSAGQLDDIIRKIVNKTTGT